LGCILEFIGCFLIVYLTLCFEGLCGSGAVCVSVNVSCDDVYGAAVCWLAVDFVCLLLFCVIIINGVEYRVLEVKQYFVHLFILMFSINIEFFKTVHMSSF
jgi:hypothetical protein